MTCYWRMALLIMISSLLLKSEFASPCTRNLEATIQTQFAEHFWDCSIYDEKSANCLGNIYRFLKLLQRESSSFAVEEARVLFIISDQSDNVVPHYFSNIFGAPQRRFPNFENREIGVERPWFFHTVLEYRGDIYDFDFSSNARIVSVENFFAEFTPYPIALYRFPAELYLEKAFSIIDGAHLGEANEGLREFSLPYRMDLNSYLELFK